MLRLAVFLAALAGPAFADVTTPGGRTIPCYCTDSTGGRVELGEIICLHVDGRSFTAQCQMSLNNPMWRELHEGCLSSGLAPGDVTPRPDGPASVPPVRG